jgi:hypothetical protein
VVSGGHRAFFVGLVLLVGGLLTSATAQGPAAASSKGTKAGAAPPFRFIYNSSSAAATVIANGWDLVDVGSQWSADHLPGRTKGLVWIGDYDNGSCSWEVSDAEVRAHVSAAARDPKVFGWFFSDEPNPYACKDAPAQHRARSNLIHSLDANTHTVIVLDSNGFKGRATRDALDQLPLWKDAADYVGLDPYPCYQHEACDFSWIDRTIRAANAAGLPYWGVVQAFDDSSWRWPTPAELSHMLAQWGTSRESGYMVFAWTWAGKSLSSKPDLLDIFRRFNGGAAGCVVPRVIGSTLRRAEGMIRRANCSVGTVSRRYSTRRSGRVISQFPRAGTQLGAKGRVRLVVSKARRI